MVSNGIGEVSVIEWSGEDCLPPSSFFPQPLSCLLCHVFLSLPSSPGRSILGLSIQVWRCCRSFPLQVCVCMLDDICSPGPLQPQRQSLCIHCSGQHTHPSSQVIFQLPPHLYIRSHACFTGVCFQSPVEREKCPLGDSTLASCVWP